MGKYNAYTLAKYYLYRMQMSQKKLHKILFFSYSWYLYYNNDDTNHLQMRLFEPENRSEGFQAWVHGPVFRELYPRFSHFGFRDICVEQFDLNNIDDEDIDFFNEMLEVYGKYSADQLEYLSHQNTAWIKARQGFAEDEVCKKLLDDKEIYSYIDRM